MPRYLFQASYTAEGAKGVLKEGGSNRRRAVEEMVGSLGGRLEAFYYAFGDTDVFLVVDLPDHAGAAALSMTASASGAVALRTTVLLTPEEIDQAAKKAPSYRPPGR